MHMRVKASAKLRRWAASISKVDDGSSLPSSTGRRDRRPSLLSKRERQNQHELWRRHRHLKQRLCPPRRCQCQSKSVEQRPHY